MRAALVAIAAASLAGAAAAQNAPPTITRPSWAEMPSAEDFSQYYPTWALRFGVSARVVLDCTVQLDGRLDCVVTEDSSPGWHFDEAALNIVRTFRMNPQLEDGRATSGGRIRLVIPFRIEGSPAP